ncbi:MAG: O157 family O-antigen flippase [Ignavibacterium sp.]
MIDKKSITKNTSYNLLGYTIPILFALFFIPRIIDGLGKERFGILSLVWIVIGYLSFLDLGIGRSLTKIIAEKLGTRKTDEIPVIFWTSLILIFLMSIFISLIIAYFIPTSFVNLLKISATLKPETEKIIILVVLSLPIITTTSALRGTIEAYQRFEIVNSIRILLGVFTFLGPIIILSFINSLFWIVVFLISLRLLIWFFYLFFCFHVNKELLKNFKFNFNSIRPLLKFGFWISIANIIGPLLLYSDRVFLGMLVSAVAITYYSTPYEVISKLLIIPSALVSVLLPVFSANFYTDSQKTKQLFITSSKFILLIIFPIVLLVVLFSFESLSIWLGNEFSLNSTRVLQFLSVGILMNCLSLIPNIFFQGTGTPKVPTLINLSELPMYILLMWISIKYWNILGAAITYMFMATIDAFLMYLFAYKRFKIERQKNVFKIIFLSGILLLIAFQINFLSLKIIFAILGVIIFLLIYWKFLLEDDEKKYFVSLFLYCKKKLFIKFY